MKPAPPVTSMRIAASTSMRHRPGRPEPAKKRDSGGSVGNDGSGPCLVPDRQAPDSGSAGATTQGPIAPAGRGPRLAVQRIAPVEHSLLLHDAPEVDWVEIPVLLPLGEHE